MYIGVLFRAEENTEATRVKRIHTAERGRCADGSRSRRAILPQYDHDLGFAIHPGWCANY